MEKIKNISDFVRVLESGTQIYIGEGLVPIPTNLLKSYTFGSVEHLCGIGYFSYEPNSTETKIQYVMIKENPSELFDINNEVGEPVEQHFQTYKKAYNYAKRAGYVVVDSFE